MARKRGGIKIVWLAWFTDCIAQWQRQDEKPYLLDDLPAVPPIPSSSSPIHTDHQISSDPDPDEDDWDEEPFEGVPKDTGSLQLSAINWSDINDEVEAAMNESDDEDDNNDDMKSVRSEDEWMGSATRYVHGRVRVVKTLGLFELLANIWFFATAAVIIALGSTESGYEALRPLMEEARTVRVECKTTISALRCRSGRNSRLIGPGIRGLRKLFPRMSWCLGRRESRRGRRVPRW